MNSLKYNVTVILPTFNSAEYLPDCIDSLKFQTMTDFELIIVDDASIDETSTIVDGYKQFFGDRLKYIKLEKRIGRGGIRNFGLSAASGKYITFLDSDDAYCPDKIKKQAKYLDSHPSMSGVSCQFFVVNIELGNPRLGEGKGGYLDILFGQTYRIFEEGIPMLMVRHELFEKVGLFDDEILRGQDTDLVIRIARVSKIGFIKEGLYLYRATDSNSFSSRVLRERVKNNIILYKKVISGDTNNNRTKVLLFVSLRLQEHVFKIRETMYFFAIYTWCYYLMKFKNQLLSMDWLLLGLKVIVGYRVTKSVKKIIKVLANN